MDDENLRLPSTALRVDDEGRLTYMADDGHRVVIVGDPDLFLRFKQLKADGRGDDEALDGS